MKLKNRNYRNRCAEFIDYNGPATSSTMLNNIKNYLGQPCGNTPKNAKALSSLLKRDDRFEYEIIKADAFMGGKHDLMLWKLKEVEE